MPNQFSLEGIQIVLFESRLASTLCDLVRLRGGIPFSAPAMKEVPIEDNPQVFPFAEKLFKGEVDLLILLTGVGTKMLVSALETRYTREKILETLRKTAIVPRGKNCFRQWTPIKRRFRCAAAW